MTDMLSFGDPSKYYAQKPGVIKKPPTRAENNLRRLLDHYDKELQRKVERAYKQWNQIIREYLRSETALRLSIGDEQKAIPVRILDGLPDPLSKVLGENDPLIWELYLNRSILNRTVQGLQFAETNYDKLVLFINERDQALIQGERCNKSELDHALAFIQQVVDKLDKKNFIKKILEIDQDILGAYYFRVPEVHIYWMVIGFIASMLDVSIEGLTVVVLTHELTHAYSHVGRDIDGARWGTADFAKTDQEIVEGLAQFYTKVICEKKLITRFPQAATAYKTLLENQPAAYRSHETWAKDIRDKAGEIVRFTMINARQKGISRYSNFQKELKAVTKSMNTISALEEIEIVEGATDGDLLQRI